MEKQLVGLALPRGRKAHARVGKRKGIRIEETARLQENVSMSVQFAPVGGVHGGRTRSLESFWGVLRPHRRGGFSPPCPSVEDPHPELLTTLCPGWCLGGSSSGTSRGLVGIIRGVEPHEGPIGRQSHLTLPQPGSSELMTSWLRPAPTVLACPPSLPRSGPQLLWPLKRLNEPRSRGLCYCL